MKEYNVVTLENGIEYTEIKRLDNNGNTYVFLSNLKMPDDFCIRKLVGDEIFGLDSDQEFDQVFKLFGKEFES